MAFHLFVLKLPPWATAAIVVALIILTFAPYRTIHPMRIPYMRVANALGLLVWLGLALYALLCRLDPGFWPALALNILGIYLLWGGLFLPARPADLER